MALYEFDSYQIDTSEGTLLRGGKPVSLTPKAFETLVVLIENAGRTVSREELMQRVWKDAFVEEQNITFNIFSLRKVLGKTSSGKAFIETVPKRGYRFLPEVRSAVGDGGQGETRGLSRIAAEEEDGISDDESQLRQPEVNNGERQNAAEMFPALQAIIPDAQPSPGSAERADVNPAPSSSAAAADYEAKLVQKYRRGFAAAITLFIAAITVGVYAFYEFSSESRNAPAFFNLTPLTRYRGTEKYPSVSPNGKLVAFAWNGEREDNFDIYVQPAGTEHPLRLTTDSADDLNPVWSPDERFIAFYRQSEIYIVPALGGAERKIGTARGESFDWSPDGKYLAVSDKISGNEPLSIFLVSLETGEKRRLTTSSGQFDGDTSPAFSPDGHLLAFMRWSSSGVTDVYITPVVGGEPRRLTGGNRLVNGLSWTADNREIVFSSNRAGGDYHLWRIPASGGEPKLIPISVESAYQPTISRQSNRLVFVQKFLDTNIWRVRATHPEQKSGAPTELISSTRYDSSPQYSPDGKRIAFRSDRSGSEEIWLSESDGANPVQLTNFGNSLTGSPRWSPDGQQLAFDSRIDGNANIYVMNTSGGGLRRLTADSAVDVVPSWSRDGRWIYFASNRSGSFQVWKAPAEGGEAAQITKHGGFAAFESPNGKFVYYAKGRSVPGLWRVPAAEGGDETPVLDALQPWFWGNWAVTDNGVYFIAPESSPAAINYFDFATGDLKKIAALEKEPVTGDAGLSVSPDEQWILYTQQDYGGSDLMMIENFR